MKPDNEKLVTETQPITTLEPFVNTVSSLEFLPFHLSTTGQSRMYFILQLYFVNQHFGKKCCWHSTRLLVLHKQRMYPTVVCAFVRLRVRHAVSFRKLHLYE